MMANRKSILIVEDEAMIGMMLEDYLDALGYRLHGLAANVVDGCALAEGPGVDAAILDCNLQGEKVWPVADLLAGRNIPFIFATGGAEELPGHYAGRPTLAKPFTIGAVEQALERVFAGAE